MDMESVKTNFEVELERPSEEILRRWRSVVWLVRMVNDLAKRSEAERKRKNLQSAQGSLNSGLLQSEQRSLNSGLLQSDQRSLNSVVVQSDQGPLNSVFLQSEQGSSLRIELSGNAESNGSSMEMAKAFLAIIGQAAVSVMTYTHNGSTKTTWPFYVVIAAILMGFISTLSAIFLHLNKKAAAGILEKFGIISTACAIIMAIGMSVLPGNMN